MILLPVLLVFIFQKMRIELENLDVGWNSMSSRRTLELRGSEFSWIGSLPSFLVKKLMMKWILF